MIELVQGFVMPCVVGVLIAEFVHRLWIGTDTAAGDDDGVTDELDPVGNDSPAEEAA